MFLTECSWPQIIAVCIVALTTYILYMIWIRRKYPPGPWPLPLIGNIHLLSDNLHVDLKDLSNEYGPIYTLWMGWSPAVVICSRALGKEVLLSKGKDFAGRALDSYTFSSITHGNEDLTSRPYDEKLKLLRRVGFSFMKAETTYGVSVQGILENEVKELLGSLKKMEGMVFDPSPFVTWSNINILMRICVNKRFSDVNDPEFTDWMKTIDSVDKAILSVFDIFPRIAHVLPWTRKVAKEASSKVDQFLGGIVDKHESTYQHGKVRGLIDALSKAHGELPDETRASVQLTKTDYALFLLDFGLGGAEQNILWAITVLLRQQEIQRKIQVELDAYVAAKRKDEEESKKGAPVFITLSDRPNLPYLNAFICEVLRRCAVIPIAVPHKALTDTSISTYRIPKNTTIFVDLYAMNMNHEDWDHPEIFKPERFLDANGQLDSNLPKNLITFGAGPRSCVGQNLVKMQLFVYLANLLLDFELTCPSIDGVPLFEDGNPGTVYYPKPFSIKVKERRH